MEDTIAAISTPVGHGGVAIIRVSGPRAFAVADAIFHSHRGKPSQFATHTIHFGTIGRNGTTVDQVMLAVMRAPRTYTGEDTIEINCHGGILTARKVLEACTRQGARLAEPGEFTKCAFLNGRMDLTQAEAVMDLISAKTDRAHTAAAHALEGHLAKRVNHARDTLVDVLAHIEAHIDFPEEDIAPESLAKLHQRVQEVIAEVESLLRTARQGQILREGIRVAIVGRPNVGKSSLMNALLGRDRSIVTPVPGTTRDTIEETASIGGIPVLLTDTAGIRRPRGKVEKLGVERSQKSVARSEIVIHVVDGSRPFSAADVKIADSYSGKPVIIAVNKCDLPSRHELPEEFNARPSFRISAITGSGLDELRSQLVKISASEDLGSAGVDVVINERHESALRSACNSLTQINITIDGHAGLEVIAQEIRLSLDCIGEVVGKTTTEDILSKVFSTFCIGK